jgi:hypothetical protein
VKLAIGIAGGVDDVPGSEAPRCHPDACPLKIFEAKVSLTRGRSKGLGVVVDHDECSPLETLNLASHITLPLPSCGSNLFGQGFPLAVVGWKVQPCFRTDPSLNLEEEYVRRQTYSGRV